jgi:hypothetical protein
MSGCAIKQTVVAAALIALALSTASSSGAASSIATLPLPDPCKLLTRTEAQALAGVKLQRPSDFGSSCTYNGYPTGPTAQVAIYVESTVPRTLRIDRLLHHKIWSVPRLGDQALEEEWHIFVREGKVWITINLVRTEAWPAYRKKLERAAAIAISRVKTTTRRAAAVRTTSAVSREPPASGGRERWSGKERLYGGSITHYAGVAYQPGVVVIGGGANAIRAQSADGLTWTIDGNAPGAADLRVGKIMLATTFAAGRVLKLSRVGSNLRVVLGPAALTDIIRDGTFESNAPIPLAKPLVYKTTLPTKPRKPHRKTQNLSAAADLPNAFSSSTPFFSERGIGVSILYDNGATGRLAATVQLYMGRPTVSFRIRISGGRLVEARLQLHGAGGLRYEIFGATLESSGNVKSGPIAVPGAFTIPLAGPFAITLTQSFNVSMQFSGRATVRTAGDYLIHGTLGFGYGSGSATPEKAGMVTRTPISQNTLSLGVGVNAFSIGWAVRATVGVGAVGFSAGGWAELKSGVALAADGSGIESLKLGCATVAVDVNSHFGVGYTIPDYVQSVVNSVLRVLGAQPIAASGGPSWGPFTVFHPPQAQWCPPRK